VLVNPPHAGDVLGGDAQRASLIFRLVGGKPEMHHSVSLTITSAGIGLIAPDPGNELTVSRASAICIAHSCDVDRELSLRRSVRAAASTLPAQTGLTAAMRCGCRRAQ
jgi:hypothetical protein